MNGAVFICFIIWPHLTNTILFYKIINKKYVHLQPHRKPKMPNCRNSRIPIITAGKVLLLIDWDNLFFRLFERFGGEEIHLETRIKKLLSWVKQDIGPLFGDYGFVFAPEHMAFVYQEMCAENSLRLMVCPKRQLSTPKINPKTGNIIKEEDTVDESIIWFAKTMISHPDFKFLCLVSGDSDFAPMLKELGENGIMRALAVPTIDSLSRTKQFIGLADKHPATQKKMLFRLDGKI